MLATDFKTRMDNGSLLAGDQGRVYGYTQAAHLLSGGDLRHDLEQIACPCTIANGSADTVTPPEGCNALAQALGIPYVSLGAVGHSCALEAAAAVNRLLGISGESK